MTPPIPYCGLPPVPAELLQRWNLDPLLLLALAGLAAFGLLARGRVNRLSYAAGLLVLVVCFVSPL